MVTIIRRRINTIQIWHVVSGLNLKGLSDETEIEMGQGILHAFLGS
jgi:hypothetical protein